MTLTLRYSSGFFAQLRESGLKITIEDDFKAAARLAVEQAEQAEKGEL